MSDQSHSDPALISPTSRVVSAFFAMMLTALSILVFFPPPNLAEAHTTPVVSKCAPTEISPIRPLL